MKKTARILALVLAVVMALAVMTACQPNQPATSKPTGSTPKGDDNKVTVTWYDGSTVLKTEEIEKGSTVKEWTPEIEGKTFTGWYKEASKSQAFDFTAAINEDTDIFAAFRSDVHVEDTNEYYLIGSGSGDMGQSGWNHENSMANLMMVKDTTITNANVYTITITMYAGDRFQICHGGTWDGQQGIGYIPGAEYADGTNPNNNTDYTAADKKYAEVKDEDGNVIFIGGDEYDKEYYVWNAILAEGQDGVYKITLTTYADASYNTIEYELVEKIEALEETHKMHLVGSMNAWNPDDDNADFDMKKSEDGKTWVGFLTVGEDGLSFKVVNQIGTAWYGDAEGKDISLAEAGTYAVRYTVEGNVVEVQKLAYYIVGTILDGEGNAVNFCVKNDVTPELTVVDGIATGTITAVDVTAIGDFAWLKDQGKPGVMAIKVVFGCEYGIQTWYAEQDTNDNFYLEAGEYTVSLDIATGVVTVAKN